MPNTSRRACVAALALLTACKGAADSPTPVRTYTYPAARGALTRTAAPGTVTRSPDVRTEAALGAGDSVVDLAASSTGPEAALLVRSPNAAARVLRWSAGDAAPMTIAELPAGFEAHGIAAHPAAATYFVSGTRAGRAQILAVAGEGRAAITVVFESPREIGPLIVGARPFDTDSGAAYRLFFAAKLPSGGTSLRSVTERGRVEYQVVGPASSAIVFPDDQPGGVTTRSGVPMSVHPQGEPMLWQDDRGCTHSLPYDKGWSGDAVVREIPCGGWTVLTPNGAAYLHWKGTEPGVTVIAIAGARSRQAMSDTFLRAPVPVPDGRGVIGLVAKGGGRSAIAFVPLDMPLADVANAWQLPPNACEARLYQSDGGLFTPADAKATELYSVYDTYSYGGSGARVPFLATTDLFWENFSAAFNGVFILSERRHAMPEFWSFVDSTNAALARTAPASKWAKAFAAIAATRGANPSGEAALISRAEGETLSLVLDTLFNFGELMPRGHYTTSPELKSYFRAVHYLTQVGARLDPAPLAALPAGVQQAAARWIEGYRPFIAAPRAQLVWSGAATPPLAPWAKHPAPMRSVFPLSWGLDNEVLESTVLHKTWAVDERIANPVEPIGIVRRLHPSGVDIAAVYGNPLARTLLAADLATYPRLGPVLDAISARRPAVTASSTIYERWLDALGSEWADSTRFPGAPAASRTWNAKRLQTGLASWATLREATVLVNERAAAAEAGEGGFENLIVEEPRGYVEPSPTTFQAIAALYESLGRTVAATEGFENGLRDAVVSHLATSAAEARRFGTMAERELRGEVLADSDYAAIQAVGGSAEHAFLVYKSLGTADEGLPTPDPIPKIADVAGDPRLGILEVAVGNPLEWHQIVPYFGRRQIVVGSTYSYYEFLSPTLYDNARWRREIAQHARPSWIQPLVAPSTASCTAPASR